MNPVAGILGSLIAVVTAGSVIAQQPWSFGARAHYGFLWPHRPSSWILVEGHAAAFEVNVERSVNGDRQWHHTFGMPRYGIGAMYTGMANPDRIGAGVRVVPYLVLPLSKGEHGSFGLRIGWGVGYIQKPFDRHLNNKQIAIGSRLNTAIQLMPEYSYTSGRWRLSTGIGLDHWSNGSYKLPNLGLNLATVSVGVSYSLKDPVALPVKADSSFEAPKREMLVVGAFGMNERGRPINGQHSVYSLTGQVQWRVGRKGTLGGGADVFNKGSMATVHHELENSSRLALTQFGVHGAGSILFGRGELFINMGAYVYTPAPDDAALYHRFGMRYRSGRHLVWNVSLKSHFATADHWEFGIGYRWK